MCWDGITEDEVKFVNDALSKFDIAAAGRAQAVWHFIRDDMGGPMAGLVWDTP